MSVNIKEFIKKIHDKAEEIKYDEMSGVEMIYIDGYYIIHNYHSNDAPFTAIITEDELTANNEYDEWIKTYRE
ncbi:MAG: hypothetical protein QXT28_07055 [Thermofilaceae archaeon]